MVFDPKTWADGELITAADLNRVEQAVDAVDEQMGSKVDATDPRLTDARTPTAHTHELADVTGLAARLADLEYNSGWRVLTSWDGTGTRVGNWTFPSGLAPTPGVSGSVRIRRVGRRVEWLFHGCSWSSNAVLFQSEIPAGFRYGDTEWIAHIIVGLNPADLGALRRRTWGFYINDASGKASHTTYGTHVVYETDEPIPTTLPGTPA